MTIDRRTFLLGSGAAAAGSLLLPGIARGADVAAPVAATPLTDWIKQQQKVTHAPSLGLAATYMGEVVWAEGFGVLEIGTNKQVTADSSFMLASISKTVAAAAMMQAWEQSLLDMDQNVADIVGFSVQNPNHPASPITTAQLATHTSSIHDSWSKITPFYVDGDSPIALADYLERYLDPTGDLYTPNSFLPQKPGARYQYSNIGATLMAYVVEVVTGMDFAAWCEANIFQVLGMDNTSWHLAGLDQDTIAHPYRYHANTGEYQDYGFYGYPDYPDGQLRTSARSLAKFLCAMSNGGHYQGNRILKAKTVKMMLSNQLGNLTYWPQGYIWYQVDPADTVPIWGHTGGDWGVATLAFFTNQQGAGAVVLSNTNAGRYSEWNALQAIRNRLINEAWHLG